LLQVALPSSTHELEEKGYVMAVVIGVDPHKASNTVAVIDEATRQVIGRERFPNDMKGNRAMLVFAHQFESRLWAVEGANGIGSSVAQRLVAAGEPVVDVPAKLAARVRVFSSGHGRKTDDTDARSVALAAISSERPTPVKPDGVTVGLRLLADRRNDLVSLRTQAVCRLHRLLRELIAGGVPRRLSAERARQALNRVRPSNVAERIRKQLATELIGDIRVLDRRIKTVTATITTEVRASNSSLIELFGVGPVIAARILGEVGDVARFPTRNHFASYSGTAPIEVSSADTTRHRLSRAGNRRINHAIHMAAVSQIRNPGPGHDYYQRKLTEGKSRKEALRCLKRRISDAIYRQLTNDAKQTT